MDLDLKINSGIVDGEIVFKLLKKKIQMNKLDSKSNTMSCLLNDYEIYNNTTSSKISMTFKFFENDSMITRIFSIAYRFILVCLYR